MSYYLAQYPYSREENNTTFAEYINAGVVRRVRKESSIYNTTEIAFYDECVYMQESENSSTVMNFQQGENYYFHGKIQKQEESSQTILIKLLSVAPVGTPEDFKVVSQTNSNEQYIKTITINNGSYNDFVDIEFMFSPLDNNFNCIVFELQRTSQDYTVGRRYAKIIYEELSLMHNLISPSIIGVNFGTVFLKIGVQSRPGMLMCINNEEIRNSRTGIFEIKNGVLFVSFFCVINAAEEETNKMDTYIDSIKGIRNTDKQLSACFFNSLSNNFPKRRIIDNFTLDYMYTGQVLGSNLTTSSLNEETSSLNEENNSESEAVL